ncbi:MAG: Uma2 family endonuclease [Planctomycetaceae bacterium]
MSTARQTHYLTPEEYLAMERASEIRHQYFDGEVFAMSGASRAHNLIVGNVSRAIGNQIVNRPCEVYQTDMRVKVSASGLYTYPDVAVVCGEPKFEDSFVDTLLSPLVLVEVLSASTEDYDRGRKFVQYRQIDSLQEYVLIAQDRQHVERWSRSDGPWTLWETDSVDAVVELTSIDCRIDVSEIYAKVQF